MSAANSPLSSLSCLTSSLVNIDIAMYTVFIILSHNPQCCFGQLKYVFVNQQLPSVSAVLDWLDWLVKTFCIHVHCFALI